MDRAHRCRPRCQNRSIPVSSVVLTEQAANDLEQAFAYYFDVSDLALAERFRDEVNAALQHIARHPGTGSLRYANIGTAVGLRFWTLSHFPYAVFHLAGPRHIDIVRVLHQASDLSRHLISQ